MNEAILAIWFFCFVLCQLIESMNHSMLNFFLCGLGHRFQRRLVPQGLQGPRVAPGAQRSWNTHIRHTKTSVWRFNGATGVGTRLSSYLNYLFFSKRYFNSRYTGLLNEPSKLCSVQEMLQVHNFFVQKWVLLLIITIFFRGWLLGVSKEKSLY